MERVAHLLARGTERLVGYHLVTHGKAVIGLEGSPDIPIAAGDIVIFPPGDPHRVVNGSPTELIDSGASVCMPPARYRKNLVANGEVVAQRRGAG